MPPVLTVAYTSDDDPEEETLQTVMPITLIDVVKTADASIADMKAAFDDNDLKEVTRTVSSSHALTTAGRPPIIRYPAARLAVDH